MCTIFHLAALFSLPRLTHGLAVLHREAVETSPMLQAGPVRQDFLPFLRSLDAELICRSANVFVEGIDRGNLWEIDPPRDLRVGKERPLVPGTDFDGRFAHGSSQTMLHRRIRYVVSQNRGVSPRRRFHLVNCTTLVLRGTKKGVFFLLVPLTEGVRPVELPFDWTRFPFASEILKGKGMQENRRDFLDVVGPRLKRRMWTHICAHNPSKCSLNSPWKRRAILATPKKRPRCECEEERNGLRCRCQRRKRS